jgi:hypothetical protein
MNPSKLLAIIFCLTTLVYVSPADAKSKHLSLNHTQRHVSNHRHHLAKAQPWQPSGLFDQAAIAPYPTEQTRQNRIIASPMGRRHIAPSRGYDMAEGIIGHPAGCPHSQFCGCGASVRIFGHPVRELYLASNWFQFAHTAPGPGMVAVRNHHVFVIESVNGDGTVVAWDANSGGHATRIHTVSLSGYSVRDPHSAGQTFSANRHHRQMSSL